MAKREIAPTGAPCWIDLMTSDTDRARAFYAELLGWEAEEPNPDFGGYFNFTLGGARVAGGMASQAGSGMPDVWSVYLATDDAVKTVEASTANGGQTYVEPMAIADLGTMAVIADNGGAAIGMWQPGEHKGFGVYAESRAPAWFELLTRDYDKAVQFYHEVFGWTTETVSDTPEFRYTVLKSEAGEEAGIMDATAFLPDGVPAHWSVYFAVDDADASLAKVVELGGTVVIPAEDTPYGRIATATDATGAYFKLLGPNLAQEQSSSS